MSRMVAASSVSRRSIPRISAPMCFVSGTTLRLVLVPASIASSLACCGYPPDRASPPASFARSGSPIINLHSGFVGGRAALHMIDEGSQLRHYLPVAGIVEKHTRRHRRERPQYAHEFSRCHGAGGNRLRHLRKTHTFDGRAKHGGKVVGDERARYGNLDRAAVVVE